MVASKYTVAIVALILFAGCGTVTDATSQTVDSTTNLPRIAVFVDPGIYRPFEEDRDYISAAGESIRQLIEQFEAGTITAKELSGGADEIIENKSQSPFLRIAIPQLVSTAAVNALLESGDTEDLPYIAHHTKSMVENDSPHADVVSQAIETLNGYWSDDEVAKMANRAIGNAKKFLDRTKSNPNAAVTNVGFALGIQALEQYLNP